MSDAPQTMPARWGLILASRGKGRQVVSDYRVYILGHIGHFQNAISLDCTDDNAAL
jgi:hypothetical protein